MLIKVNTMTDEFYTPKEIAKKLKVSYMTVYRWIKDNKLQAYKAGKQYRIREKDLKSFLQDKNEK